MREPQTILVTGAAGFIGSHLCEALLRRGDHVVGIDNFDPYYDVALKKRNLDEVRAASCNSAFTFFECDIRDQDALRRIFTLHQPQGVIHLAALAGVRPSIRRPADYAEVNVVGTSRLLQCAAEVGVARVVLASSSSVYGLETPTPFTETAPSDSPMSPYAATKRAMEHLGFAFHHTTGMPVSCLRFFTVYGPRQRPDLAIARFMRAIAEGHPIEMYGDGDSSRDYTFIDDIIEGMLSALDRTPRAGYRVWNVGSDTPTSLRDLISAIASTVGRQPIVRQVDGFIGDMQHTWADLTRARTELGYRPNTSLHDGLREQWTWMQSDVQAAACAGVAVRSIRGGMVATMRRTDQT